MQGLGGIFYLSPAFFLPLCLLTKMQVLPAQGGEFKELALL